MFSRNMNYLIIINIITLAAFGIDKLAAIKHRRRIREAILLGLVVIGGSVGALIGMYIFNHKVHKAFFRVGIPLMLIIQIVVLYTLENV
ncbi:MAG: DUF1294 domain-containing protein [Eubacterium sp.]|nr:DUF1294 domain-containing protein [Eubacterium sp.]